MPARPATPARRHQWIDVLRGTSVLMVIVLHAYQYAFSGYVPDGVEMRHSALTDAVRAVNVACAPFRMQLMFLLSGLFVARSLDKGSAPYLLGKLRHVLYPFLLWSLVIFLIRDGGAALLKREPVQWAQLGMIVTGTSTLTWFLYDLFIFYLVTPYLRRFNPLLVVLGAGLLALLVPPSLYVQPALFYYFIYFFVGDYVTRAKIDLSAWPGLGWLLLSAVSLVALMLVAHLGGLPKQWPGYLPLVLGALPLLVQAAAFASRFAWSAPLTFVGRNSIVFYLLHYPPYIVLAYPLHKLSHDGTLLLGALLAAGLGVPLLVCLLRDRFGVGAVNLLFSMPDRDARQRLLTQRA
ncbi:acyltransferase [Pseudoxanthomonas sp. GM95]|uniref:acyltransferase family protein n=1 Tax=Pseudoxanthomonas sp. GM95 TaxID=1881043 RepID=UPI001587E65B|nr:acyltransferase [Pseudoxanthomonas sp. GM95]